MIPVFEIKALLDALGTLGTLTVGMMPASPDAIGTIYEYGGQMPERGFGVSGIQYEKPAFQIAFRGDPFDYETPRGLAEIAYQYLMTIQPGALTGTIDTEYLQITPQQSPFPVAPMDQNKRHKIGFNIYVTKGQSV